MKFTFNTGRPYTAQGQNIRVEVESLTNADDLGMYQAKIWFYDESRGIAGSYLETLFDTDRQPQVQRSVMAVYDACKYQNESLPSTPGGAR